MYMNNNICSILKIILPFFIFLLIVSSKANSSDIKKSESYIMVLYSKFNETKKSEIQPFCKIENAPNFHGKFEKVLLSIYQSASGKITSSFLPKNLDEMLIFRRNCILSKYVEGAQLLGYKFIDIDNYIDLKLPFEKKYIHRIFYGDNNLYMLTNSQYGNLFEQVTLSNLESIKVVKLPINDVDEIIIGFVIDKEKYKAYIFTYEVIMDIPYTCNKRYVIKITEIDLKSFEVCSTKEFPAASIFPIHIESSSFFMFDFNKKKILEYQFNRLEPVNEYQVSSNVNYIVLLKDSLIVPTIDDNKILIINRITRKIRSVPVRFSPLFSINDNDYIYFWNKESEIGIYEIQGEHVKYIHPPQKGLMIDFVIPVKTNFEGLKWLEEKLLYY